MLTSVGKAVLVEHVEQEGQKAEIAEVPCHFWWFFFRESFLQYFSMTGGRQFDGSKITQMSIEDMIGSREAPCLEVRRRQWMVSGSLRSDGGE